MHVPNTQVCTAAFQLLVVDPHTTFVNLETLDLDVEGSLLNRSTVIDQLAAALQSGRSLRHVQIILLAQCKKKKQ